MSARRNLDPDLAYGDMPPPQRWDREKFERYSRGGGYDERDIRFQERDRLDGGRERRYVDLDVTDRRGPRGFEERERLVEEDRYIPTARRRPEFLQEPTQSDAAQTALTPYRRKSFVERDADVRIAVPPPPRPQIIRRQSSLDTFDRRPPPPRLGDQYRVPPDVPVPLPIRRPRSPPREHDHYWEHEFEEIRHRDLEPESVEEYGDVRIRRERSRGPQPRKSITKIGSGESSSSFEEIETIEKRKTKVEIGKRGKTRMPKRLAHKQAIIDLGLPFEEEDDFIIIQRALGKEHIDEVIEKSRTYKTSDKTTYKFEEKIDLPRPANETVEETVKRTEIIENLPTFRFDHHHSRPSSPDRLVGSLQIGRTRPRSVSSHQPTRYSREIIEDRFDESSRGAGQLTVVPSERKTELEIKDEIAQLQAERARLRRERKASTKLQAPSLHDQGDFELVERRQVIEEIPGRDWETLRVEKNRKGRSRSTAPDPRLVGLAVSTWT